ncbi:MAG: ArsR family transcriptional regulator [Methanocalculus sp. MSAO_Arc2]|uniref:V4R domain-containing protein n=1 Tax=Methanocalculus sp. MSAO_Arc2 TaxID=2293855 RepID=UPI000FF7A156|nr:MAG: ArsR family transcriptional regulator [Methanocalculus sp. MSAO_Arc2]
MRDTRHNVSLYGTTSGVRIVSNPIRRSILELLREGELSFETIVRSSGRAKSTISAHLSALADEGIIGSHPGENDERKKYFFLTAHFIGDLAPDDRIQDDLEAYASRYRDGGVDPFALYRLVYRTFRVSLLMEGISIDPLLKRCGEAVGRAIFPGVAAPDLDTFTDNLIMFWERHQLGRIEDLTLDPLRLSVYDCFECVDLPYLGRPACSFDSGLFSVLFSEQLTTPVEAVERECYAAGDPCCSFEFVVMDH